MCLRGNYLWVIGHFLGLGKSCDWAFCVEVGWQVNTRLAACREQRGEWARHTLFSGRNCNFLSVLLKLSRIAVLVLHFVQFTICSGYSSFKKMFLHRVCGEFSGWICHVLRNNFSRLSQRWMKTCSRYSPSQRQIWDEHRGLLTYRPKCQESGRTEGTSGRREPAHSWGGDWRQCDWEHRSAWLMKEP